MFTPVNPEGAPALDQLEKLVSLFVSQELDGLYILGSTGQGVLFSESQRNAVIKKVCEVAAGRIPVMVQVGALTTAESVRLARYAANCGVDGISAVGPVYYSGNAEMALQHYKCIAEVTDLPFYPYQWGDNFIPGETIDFVRRLMEIPNVAGMKLTTNALLEISAISNFAGDKLSLFSGSDELFCHASLCGTVGAIGSFYNLWGVSCKHVLEEFVGGNYALAKEFMLSFQEVVREVLPDIWPFFRKAMLIKYGIDIGMPKPPLGNGQKQWDDRRVEKVLERIESLAQPVSLKDH